VAERRTEYSVSVVACKNTNQRDTQAVHTRVLCLYFLYPICVFLCPTKSRICRTAEYSVEVSVNKAILENVTILWDTMPCSPYVNRRFERTHHLHFLGRKLAE
jgi:hypothetical protein